MAVEKADNLPEEAARDFTVRQHKAAYGIGIAIIGMGIFFLVLDIIYHVSHIALWMYAVILLILLFGMLVCLEAKNRQLAVTKNGLYYCNMFGVAKRFEVEDIGFAKAVFSTAWHLDCVLYDKKGKKICRLEAGMENMDRMFLCLHDNKVDIHMGKGVKQAMGDLAPSEMGMFSQEIIEEENLSDLSGRIYGQAEALLEEWKERNRKLGAELLYGYAEYYGGRLDPEADVQPESSRITGNGKKLPDDYVCVLEVYIQKDGSMVRNRKGKLQYMVCPVFYKRKAMTKEAEIRFYYNAGWKEDMESVLAYWEKYLPKHKFVLEQTGLGYELKKEIRTGGDRSE